MKLFQILQRSISEIFDDPRDEQRISEIIQNRYWIHDIQKLASMFDRTFKPVRDDELIVLMVKWVYFHIYWKWKTPKYSHLDIGLHSFLAKMYLHRAYSKICRDWNLCEKIHHGEFTDEMQLALSIQEALPGDNSILAASLIVKIGVKDFCGCDNVSNLPHELNK